MYKKLILFIVLIFFRASTVFASEYSSNDVQVNVVRDGDQFKISASYHTPLNLCQAYNYLTDYEAAKNVPGVIESKFSRESLNKVIVERSAEETILLFRVRLHTSLEYTEYPPYKTEFVQLKGDSKVFKGQWLIQPVSDGSIFQYQGLLEPDSFLPMFVIEYFIQHNLKDRFSVLAKIAADRHKNAPDLCPRL